MSQLKRVAVDSSAAQIVFNPGAGAPVLFTSFMLPTIAQGNLYNQRLTNNVRIKYVDGLFVAANAHTVGRYLRFSVVGLRGSNNAADTTNWTDLYVDPSSLVKNGPSGSSFDQFQKINKDEYTRIYDKTFYIPGTTEGEPNSTRVQKLKLRMNRLVQYVFNSSDIRNGSFWLVIQCMEKTGSTPTNAAVYMDYRVITYYNDVR